MKIIVTLEVNVDPEKWEYADGAQAIRDDVKSYVLTSVQGAALIEEADGEITLR